jgi:phenylalanyl-tRNA synthetase beta chain
VSTIKHLQRGQAADVSIGDTGVGYVGRLDQDLAASYKFRQPVYLAEIDLETILAMPTAPVNYHPLPRFPGVVRDVSFAVERSVSFDAIRNAVDSQNVELCRSVEFVDLYEGKGLADNERSITVRFEYRSDERTLVDDEVDQAHGRIVSAVTDLLSARLRT